MNKTVFLILTLCAAITLTLNPARAHRFNVVLLVPLSNATQTQVQQIREGFMLATAERDSHPDQESDGHLGGLDVYVTVIEGTAKFERLATQGTISIVAAFGAKADLIPVRKTLDEKKIVLLLPSQPLFPNSGPPAVAAFNSAYQREYGNTPSIHAAQGYNAARRIDVAVRAQGGVDNSELLRQSFRKTATGFTW
jgi:hypothetical protein